MSRALKSGPSLLVTAVLLLHHHRRCCGMNTYIIRNNVIVFVCLHLVNYDRMCVCLFVIRVIIPFCLFFWTNTSLHHHSLNLREPAGVGYLSQGEEGRGQESQMMVKQTTTGWRDGWMEEFSFFVLHLLPAARCLQAFFKVIFLS